MRNGSHRFWLCIAAAVAVIVIAVPAASAKVVWYDTGLSLQLKRHNGAYHGYVMSKVRTCERGRRVVLFRQRRGADHKLGSDRTNGHGLFAVVGPEFGNTSPFTCMSR